MKGITVTLWEPTETGRDDFNRPVYEEVAVNVNNVLVAPVTADDIPSTLDLNGAKITYQLGLPKGDAHIWKGRRVSFFGEDWRVVSSPIKGIDEMIPLSWNAKVMVERYE